MKILIVCVLGWAMMALSRAAENHDLVKRYLFCHTGWTKINGACFKYVSTPMTWARAEKKCLTMGAHLASVENQHEYHEIQKMTAPYGYKQTWVGGSDAQENNIWFWTDGVKFIYTKWCRGEPNNFWGSQHCLSINYTGRKCWGDMGCKAPRPFICEKRGFGLLG
ncbi:ladderlectin-like isoform X2 [Channa argus]|uniref:ladderlectin-like isoform X2 n=1 Tax=Channa argus TaxID=215402 RepID=UPI003520044A